MADNGMPNWEIGLGVALDQQSLNAAAKALELIGDHISDLGKSGEVTDKQLRSFTNRLENLRGQFNDIAKGSDQAAKGIQDVGKAAEQASKGGRFDQMTSEIKELNAELRQSAELYYNLGNNNPLSALAFEFDPKLADAIIGAESIKNIDAYAVAMENVRKRSEATRVEEERRQAEVRKLAREIQNLVKEQERLAQLRTNQSQQSHLQATKDEQRLRQRELDLLQQEIQKRAELQSLQARQNDANWAHSDRQAETARASELAGLKQQILARHTEEATQAVNKQAASLPTLRYALYDVAQTAGIASAALTAMVGASVAASASYETSFTAVERTSGATGEAVGKLRDDLLQLSREIPQTFGEITNIAARGAQLGVANDQLDSFTDTVAKFVATSDTVSLDQAVEAFGRISNLLGDTDFNRIGSAITLVGVNAAATEAQIVKTTQELAPFATAVGMSTEGVIALATALGSLGQPPERARSAFLTLQRVMDNAIVDGSENLDAFARLLGKTADQTANLWKQDPDAFISAFARSLGSVENLTTAFAELGINERRAVQVFQALAADARNAGGELSVLERAMQDSALGYAEGTELARQYGLIVDDLASKWQLFQNAIMELTSGLGDSLAPVIKDALDMFTSMIQAIADIVNTPIGQYFAQQAGGVAIIVAGVLGLVGSVALLLASMAGVKTVLGAVGIESVRAAFTLKGLSEAFATVSIGANASAASIARFTTVTRVALRALGVIGVALMAGGAAWELYRKSSMSATDRMEEFFTSTSDIHSAVQKDTAALEEGADAFFKFETEVKEADKSMVEFEKRHGTTQEVLGLTEGGLRTTTEALKEQTLAWGENSLAATKNMLLQSEMFRDVANTPQMGKFLELIGAEMDVFLNKSAHEGQAAGMEYIRGLVQAFMEQSGGEGLAGKFSLDELLLVDGWESTFGHGLSDTAQAVEGLRIDVQMTEMVMKLLGITAEETGEDLAEAASGADIFRQEIDSIMGSVFDGVNAFYALNDSLFALGEEFYNSGATAAFSGDAMQQAIQNVMLSSGDMPTAAANLQVLYDFILANTSATVADLSLLAQMIAQVTASAGGSVAAPTMVMPDFSAFERGMARAARSTGGVGRAAGQGARSAQKELRTVLDWANDLAKVWDRAFDLRFGVQNAKDATADFLQKLRDDTEKALKSIRDLRTEIQKLSGDLSGIDAEISKTQYFMSVAIEYGDTARAEQLQAQLEKLEADRAKTSNDLADAQAKLAEEQAALNKSTQGNSQSARDNRKTLQDLFGTYTDQLRAYAEAGASQDELARKSEELRGEFVKQATQLGYQRKDLKEYELAFDDVSTAIRNVPRNVTVEIRGLGAAQAALKEFESSTKKAVDNARNAARGGVNIPISSTFNDSGLKKMMRGMEIAAEVDRLMKLLASEKDPQGGRYIAQSIGHYKRLLHSGNYAEGGYTGRGGKYDPAGIVHRGEYVVPKHLVNQRTGLPYADAYARLAGATTAPSRGYASGGYVQSSYPSTVALTPATIQAIANAVQPHLFLNDRIVGESAAQSYTRESTIGAY